MRTSNLIIILTFVLFVAGGGIFVYKKKDQLFGKKAEPINKSKAEKPETPQTGYAHPQRKQRPNESIRALQRHLNSMLPAGHEPLAEDGIWGPKTQAAFDYMKHQDAAGNLDSAAENLLNAYQKITDFTFTKTPLALSPAGVLYNGSKKLVSDVGDWISRTF